VLGAARWLLSGERGTLSVSDYERSNGRAAARITNAITGE
jgi:hypothetical protein